MSTDYSDYSGFSDKHDTVETINREKEHDKEPKIAIVVSPEVRGNYPRVITYVIQAHIIRKSVTNAIVVPPPEGIQLDKDHAEFWQDLYRRCGLSASIARPSFEVLTEYYKTYGNINSFNPIVELCSVLSVKHQVNITAYDSMKLGSTIELRESRGGEVFCPVGAQEKDDYEELPPGLVIYTNSNTVLSTGWNHRKSDYANLTNETTRFTFFIESSPTRIVHQVQAYGDLKKIFSIIHFGRYDSKPPVLSDHNNIM